MKDAERYREETGREPPPPTDHPLGWQWEYRGSKAEREALRGNLFEEPEDDPEPIGVHPDQESLL